MRAESTHGFGCCYEPKHGRDSNALQGLKTACCRLQPPEARGNLVLMRTDEGPEAMTAAKPGGRQPTPLAAFMLGCLVAGALLGPHQQLRNGAALVAPEHDNEGRAATASAPGPPLPLPWQPLLSTAARRRGIAFYGSGRRIERVAARLLAGLPITAATLGGSVTVGAGSSGQKGGPKPNSYPQLFFRFLNASFPHRDHVFLNKGIGATTSGIYAVCADKMLPEGVDLVVVELTFNEPEDAPFTFPQRRGFERLLRKLARMPRSPAVVVLHHYAWHYSRGDGVAAGLFYRPAESQLSTLAQYYDLPSPSLRNALYPLMQADVAPFKVGRVRKAGDKSLVGAKLPVAGPKLVDEYFYHDGIHPSDTGHKALAELLAAVVQTAVANVLADGKVPRPGRPPEPKPLKLPPPMIPGNNDAPTSVCSMQEDFKGVAKGMSGFSYVAERPNGTTFVEQKWGYRGESPGSWIELQVSTEETPGQRGQATVYLGHLRSYEGMGAVRVECRSGCACAPSRADGLWSARVSLMQMHTFQTTQHPRCTIRATILDLPTSGSGGSRGRGHKFQLSAIMVAHQPVVLSSYASQAADLASVAG
ncbi:hypothetical protein ABPG75_001920 [Micractinium tetrahymenae]